MRKMVVGAALLALLPATAIADSAAGRFNCSAESGSIVWQHAAPASAVEVSGVCGPSTGGPCPLESLADAATALNDVGCTTRTVGDVGHLLCTARSAPQLQRLIEQACALFY